MSLTHLTYVLLRLVLSNTWISNIFITQFFSPGSSDGRESAYNAGDLDLISGSERSPGEGNGNPLRYSFLENSMDRGAWRAVVHGIAKSWT